MIKVLHMIHGFNTGGAETLVKNYALLLDKTKFDLTVLCLHHQDSPYEIILKKSGANIIYMSDKFSNKLEKKLFLRSTMRKIVRDIEPDIIHTHLLMNDFLRYIKPKKDTKYFYTQHFALDRLDEKEKKAISWLLQNYSSQLIGINSDMVTELNSLFGVTNSIMLRNGIFLDAFTNKIDKEKIRASIGIPINKKILVHVGRFAPIKNHDFLVDVFEELLTLRDDVFLLMIGSGSEVKRIKERLDSNSTRNYKILSNRTDVPELLMMSDIGIMTSISEGLGISVIEMQAARIPVVASTGVPLTAKVSEYLYFLDLKDGAKTWALKINELLEYKADYRSLNIQEWDIREVVRKLEDLYIESMKQR